MPKYFLGYVVGFLGVLLVTFSSYAQSPITTESLPATPEAPEERPVGEETLKATLDAQVSPSQSPRAPLGSIELEATKAPQMAPREVETNGMQWAVVAVGFLFLSLFGNAFQFYRHRVHSQTAGNALRSTFNSIGLSLGRCNGKTRELDGRLKSQKVPDPVLLKEFREFTVNIEFILRALNEQLVSVARNLGQHAMTEEGGASGDSGNEAGKGPSNESDETVERSGTL